MKSIKKNELLAQIRSRRPRILVVGDIMLDHYVSGDVNRISPEAPVPILNFKKEKNVLGGAGNVVHNLVNLGADVRLSSIIGDDREGQDVKKLLGLLEIDFRDLHITSNINTTKKTRYISKGNQLLRLDKDSVGFQTSDFIALEAKLKVQINHLDCIIISDYDKGVCSTALIQNIIQEAKKNRIPIFVDPKGKNWFKYSNATCITPNTKEAEMELNVKLINDSDYELAANLLIKKYKLKSCLITRGSKGMSYYFDNQIIHQSVSRKEVFDVSGAGDSVIACIALTYVLGLDIKNSLELSTQISSAVVQYEGTVPFSLDMLDKI